MPTAQNDASDSSAASARNNAFTSEKDMASFMDGMNLASDSVSKDVDDVVDHSISTAPNHSSNSFAESARNTAFTSDKDMSAFMASMTFASASGSQCVDGCVDHSFHETPPPENPIRIQKCHALENVDCPICWVTLGHNDLKVDDPRTHDQYTADDEWRHLSCWDSKHPSIATIFQSQNGDISLGLFEATARNILVGWKDLECSDRWKVLQHIFNQNLPSFQVSLGHIIRVTPCKNCTTCQSPNTCSWSEVGCDEPALPTQTCPRNGCSNQLHHICQIKFQEANGLPEDLFCCYHCHAGAKGVRSQQSTISILGRQTSPPRSQSQRQRSRSLDINTHAEAIEQRPRTRSQSTGRTRTFRSRTNTQHNSNVDLGTFGTFRLYFL